MIHLYFGDGKGKTSAAVGAAVRYANYGKAVIVQFLKDGRSGEIEFIKSLDNKNLSCISHMYLDRFYYTLTDSEKLLVKTAAMENLTEAQNQIQNGIKFLVLDEIVDCVSLKIIDLKVLLDFLQKNREVAEIVLTGHSAPKELLAMSDYCSEITSVKHPYIDKKMPARQGTEY